MACDLLGDVGFLNADEGLPQPGRVLYTSRKTANKPVIRIKMKIEMNVRN